MNGLQRYAKLLVNYCLSVQPNDRVLVKSTTAAEPLLKHVHDEILKAGGFPYFQISVQGTESSFYNIASITQLNHINAFDELALKQFDCYLVIRAPHNLKEGYGIDAAKRKQRAQALQELNEIYFSRTASGELKRCLCQYPTNAAAQEANMSLEDYEQFVLNACHLFAEDATERWLSVRREQQQLVDFLHQKQTIRFYNPNHETDITFSTKGRTWINSDGRNNMPSGEVFTAPVEDSVNGEITFSYPSIYRGKEVENVRLTVRNGFITDWSATKGKKLLDEVFAIDGARRFGEAAIGTNYQIQQITKNILFDEKIGGSIHMAVGQSYKQCGGKNQSAIHWDLITDMQNGGQIFADDKLFYENGKVIIDL